MKKKFLIIALVVALTVSMSAVFVSCDNDNADYKIGISKFIGIPALDSASQGFRDELTRLMTEQGKTVSYSEKDASGESGQVGSITSSLLSKRPDLVFAIATPSVLSMIEPAADKGIPVVASAVTSYSDDMLKFGNLTGTSDMNPIKEQFDIMKLLDKEESKKMGVIYTTSEPNSVMQKDILKQYCQQAGYTLKEAGVSDRNDIASTLKTLSDCAVIYIPTDNILSNASALIHETNKNNSELKKPIVWGEVAPHEKSGVATYSIDYYELGKISARQAFDILFNGTSPKDIPVATMDEYKFVLNEKVAEEIDYVIPDSIKALKK